jgi:hypothetical protein
MNFENNQQFPAINQVPDLDQEVILGFNQAKHVNAPTNEEELKSQCIWGNRYFTYNNHNNQARTLYFKNCIKKGIMTVGDLMYNNGDISKDYILNKLEDHTFFFADYMILKATVNRFRHLLTNNIPTEVDEEVDENKSLDFETKDGTVIINGQKSSFFYENNLLKQTQYNRQKEKWKVSLSLAEDYDGHTKINN